jgi:hypothetical protein
MIKPKRTRLLFLTIFFVAFALASTQSVAKDKERIAVLDLKNKAGVKPDEVGYLSDVLRQVASELPTRQFSIMTKDNIP